MQIQTAIRRPILTQIASLVTMPSKSPIHERPISPPRSIRKKGSFKRCPPSSTTGPVQHSRITSSQRGMILDIMKRLRTRSPETGVVKKSEFLDACVIVAGRLKGKKIANRCIRKGLVVPYGDTVYLSSKSIEQELQNRLSPSKEAMQDLLLKKQKKLEQMEDTKQRMDALVEGNTQRVQLLVLAVWVAQWMIYFHLTYVHFSWDVMEPISYFTAYFVGNGLLLYYICSGKLCLYKNMMNSYRDRERRKFYQLASFDPEEYIKLKDEIDLYRRMHSIRLKFRAVADELVFFCTNINGVMSITSSSYGLSEEEITQQMVAEMEQLVDGLTTQDKKILRRAFRTIDLDSNGQIDPKELRVFLSLKWKQVLPPETIDSVLALADVDSDGLISFEEFARFQVKYMSLCRGYCADCKKVDDFEDANQVYDSKLLQPLLRRHLRKVEQGMDDEDYWQNAIRCLMQ